MKRNNKRQGFYTRGFTTFLIALSFLVLMVSGIVLYVSPRGRMANWTGWGLWGLEKGQWGGIHITTALLFLMIVALHIFFNWKVLLNYIRSRRTQGFRMKKEFAAAMLVGVLFVAGTVADVPPFSTVIGIHEEIKDYWDSSTQAAPVAHAEDLPLSELANHISMPVETILSKLDHQGIKVSDPNARVGDIAHENGMNPDDLYARLTRGGGRNRNTSYAQTDAHVPGGYAGQGLGRMSLAQYCDAQGLDVGIVVADLKQQGIATTASQNFRDLARSMNMAPIDLANLARKASTQAK